MSLTDYSFSLGGIRIHFRDVRGANARPHFSFEAPIGKYLDPSDSPADLDLTVEPLEADPPRSGKLLFDSGAIWQLFDQGDTYRIECRVHGELYKVAFLSKDLTRGTLQLAPDDITITYPLQYPLDEVILNLLLPRCGAVELHACALVDQNGKGYLFAGNSGAGKTTTARLWQHDAAEILSDDRVIVRRENGAWWMYGTPWHGDAEICSTSRARLDRIFLLDKSTLNEMRALSPAATVARLLSCTFPPFHDAGGMSAVTGTLAAISADVPVTNFSFTNDHSAVDFIRETLEAAA